MPKATTKSIAPKGSPAAVAPDNRTPQERLDAAQAAMRAAKTPAEMSAAAKAVGDAAKAVAKAEAAETKRKATAEQVAALETILDAAKMAVAEWADLPGDAARLLEAPLDDGSNAADCEDKAAYAEATAKARDLLVQLAKALGAKVGGVGSSGTYVPVANRTGDPAKPPNAQQRRILAALAAAGKDGLSKEQLVTNANIPKNYVAEQIGTDGEMRSEYVLGGGPRKLSPAGLVKVGSVDVDGQAERRYWITAAGAKAAKELAKAAG